MKPWGSTSLEHISIRNARQRDNQKRPFALWTGSRKIGEEFSSAGAHRGGAMRGEILQLSQDGVATLWGLRREIGQPLHGEGLHDAAGVAQITRKDAIHNLAFARIPLKAR